MPATHLKSILTRTIVAALVISGIFDASVSCGRGAGGGGAGPSTGTGGAFYFAGDGSVPPRCDGGLPPIEPPDARPPCDAGGPVSYQTDVAPIIGACSGEICHGGWTYSTVVDRPSTECCGMFLVAPGDPAKSYLLRKLEGKNLCWGDRMPLDRAPISEASLQKIADWICQGAPND